MEITRESIVAAASRISGHIRSTPVLALDSRSHSFPGRLVLKLEHLQVAGSFKARGAFNLLISRAPSSVVAASGGNFGFALGHAARELEIEADIFVPRTSPEEKITAVRSTGSNVHVIPGFYDDALAASQEHARRTGAEFAHAFDLPEVVAGAGTCALEIATQVPEVDTLLVAVGGGGLIAGVASWFRDRARVVGVGTTGTPTLHAARSAGEPVQVEVSGIAVSALGAA
ncbi:MAG TPA: pyridoxal-phosphate dependent enzyme, partial [Acidimicrobiia bacterium]